MLFQNIVRRFTPEANFLKKVTALEHAKHSIYLSSKSSSISAVRSVNGFSPRFYSQQEPTENLPIVEFDYVKRATSQNEVMIIDVREPDEIKEHGKIPNSVNIPLGTISTTLALSEKDFKQTFNRPKPKENTEMIFYCMVGKRSAKAQQSAANLGFKNVKNYLGSWTDWAVKIQ